MPLLPTVSGEMVMVPLTNKQKVRVWRKKKAKEGGKNMSMWINPETVKQIDELLIRYPDKNKASLVAFAIQCLHDQRVAENK